MRHFGLKPRPPEPTISSSNYADSLLREILDSTPLRCWEVEEVMEAARTFDEVTKGIGHLRVELLFYHSLRLSGVEHRTIIEALDRLPSL